MGWFSKNPAAELRALEDQLKHRQEMTRKEQRRLAEQAQKLRDGIAARHQANKSEAIKRAKVAHDAIDGRERAERRFRWFK